MAISNTSIRRAGPATTDGVQTDFPFEFKVFNADDLLVTASEDGIETVLVHEIDYTVDLNPDQDEDPGGTVVIDPALDGPSITITSGMAAVQPTVFTNSGGFFPRVLNNALDRVTILVQQVLEKLDRAMLSPLDTSAVAGQFPVVLPGGGYGFSPGTGSDSTFRSDLASTAAGKGTELIGFKQDYTDAVNRDLRQKMSETVSVLDFGAVADGATNDQPAFEKALATGKSVFVPAGVYRVNSPIIINNTGQRLFGENGHETLLTTAAASTHDIMRIAETHVEVDHLHFRPGSASNVCLRVFKAMAHIHDNRFLSAVNGSGTAIVLDEVDPATATTYAGSYTHLISCNRFGADGYAFEFAIDCLSPTNGQQANVITSNYCLGNTFVRVAKGGGNKYINNLCQSRTGTIGVPAGTCFDFNVDVTGEVVANNYIERYLYAALLRRLTDDYWCLDLVDNHFDYCTNKAYSLGTKLFRENDHVALRDRVANWSRQYDVLTKYTFAAPTGAVVFEAISADGAFKPDFMAFRSQQALAYTANGQTKTATKSFCSISGDGAARTGCFLGNGTHDGQLLILRGRTWGVEILNNPGGTQNIVFEANAASATFGQAAGNVMIMTLVWDANYSGGHWFELSRTTAA